MALPPSQTAWKLRPLLYRQGNCSHQATERVISNPPIGIFSLKLQSSPLDYHHPSPLQTRKIGVIDVSLVYNHFALY